MDDGNRVIALKNKIGRGHGQQRNQDPKENSHQVHLPPSHHPLRHKSWKWRRKRNSGRDFCHERVKGPFNLLPYLTTADAETRSFGRHEFIYKVIDGVDIMQNNWINGTFY